MTNIESNIERIDMSTTKAQQLQPGDVCYTKEGRKAKFVAAIPDGYVVEPVFTFDDSDDEDDEFTDGMEVVNAVFAQPPVAVNDEAVAKLQKDEQDLQTRIGKLHEKEYTTDQDRKRLLAKLKQVDALMRLDEFIDGKITHFVIKPEYGPVNISAKEFALQDGHGNRINGNLKLLTLFGRTNGELSWGLNQYRDGSGSWAEVYPCLSLEEATEKALGLCNAFFERCRTTAEKPYGLDRWVKGAKALGFEVPADIEEILLSSEREGLDRTIAQYEKTLADARAKREALDATS